MVPDNQMDELLPGASVGAKRKEHPEGDAWGRAPEDSYAPDSLQAMMGRAPCRVGEGEWERPLMETMLMCVRDLSTDAQDLKQAVYKSWELPRDCAYIEKGMQYKVAYGEACQRARGSGMAVGAPRTSSLSAST